MALPSASPLAGPNVGAADRGRAAGCGGGADCSGGPTAGGMVPGGLGGVAAVTELAEAPAPADEPEFAITLGLAGAPEAAGRAGALAPLLAADVAALAFSSGSATGP